jgi:N-acetylmuramoyl-L-alanine amidase
LRLVAPNQRGDDVQVLQTTLGKLGFDCGRADGIFGPATSRALAEFQRNCGLTVDSVCGPVTVHALEVNSAQSGTGPGVAAIREVERLGHLDPSLQDLRTVLGQFGGLSPLVRHVARALRQHGANVIAVDELDPSLQASTANRHAATVYLGFEARPDACCTVSYYAAPGFESAGGRSLATRIADAFDERLHLRPAVAGMRLAVLRETRMTAVVCSLGPVQRVVDDAASITEALVEAVSRWADAPLAPLADRN